MEFGLNQEKINKILELKKSQNAIILAHYYQSPDVQKIADFMGDSLELAKKAASAKADKIIFCGVHFMAEMAKLLNPNTAVYLPKMNAGCSLADSCNTSDLDQFLSQFENPYVIGYINTTLDVKTRCNIICTSSNAERVVLEAPKDRPTILIPDVNLGQYLIKKTGRNLHLWNGKCEVHRELSLQKVVALMEAYPEAKLIAHPESEPELQAKAHFLGATSKLLQYVIEDDAKTYIVATEYGIVNVMKEKAPTKKIIPAPINMPNACACSECNYMKMINLDNIYHTMLTNQNEIILDQYIAEKAMIPLKRMMDMN